MVAANATTPTFYIEPELKNALRKAAKQDHCSIANGATLFIRDYCKHNGIPIQKSQVIKRGNK